MRVHDAPGPLDHGKGGRDAMAFCGPETPAPVSGMPEGAPGASTALQSRQSGSPQPTPNPLRRQAATLNGSHTASQAPDDPRDGSGRPSATAPAPRAIQPEPGEVSVG